MIDQFAIAAPRLSISRLTLTGAFVAFVVFSACWAAGAAGIVGSHAFIVLFTVAPIASVKALLTGGASAAGFGALTGALVAVGYNLTGRYSAR